MDEIINTIISLLSLPLFLIMTPLDYLLDKIPGIDIIPTAISSVAVYIGSLPSTVVSLFGMNPYLWNAIFVTFVTYLLAVPSINLIKKVWAFFRP